jgi:hypothetical protein
MTLPKNAPKYDDCSLEELYKFVAMRNIPFRFTRAQAHTKTQYKSDKEERRKLTKALQKADAAATIHFMALPPELRDQVYDYILTDTAKRGLTHAELKGFRDRMWRVSPKFSTELGDLFSRGEYELMPALEDEPSTPSHRSSLPTQGFPRSTQPAHSGAPYSSNMTICVFGSMGQGKSTQTYNLISLPTTLWHDWNQLAITLLGSWGLGAALMSVGDCVSLHSAINRHKPTMTSD